LIEHQGLERLDPFDIRVLGELYQIVLGEEESVPSESIMHLDNDESASDDDADGCKKNGVIVPSNVPDDPDPGRHAQSDHYAGQYCNKIGGDDDTSLTILVPVGR
ncbi:MAG: hypothetical protein Q9192_008626, partial [Flavoplaca navasiana]